MMIGRYVGLAMSAEQALADAFVVVGLRHAVEPEMRSAARLYSGFCAGEVAERPIASPC